MFSFLEKLFGGSQNSQLNKMRSTVAEINAMEDSIKQLSDASLTAKTDEFKRRLNNGETLDDILPVKACMLLPSMITWPSVTASGWVNFIMHWVFLSV